MNPRNRKEQKNPFCVSSVYIIKDNNNTAYRVSHSQSKSLYTNDCFKMKPVVDYIQDNLTGNTIEQSTLERKIHISYKKMKNKKLKRLMMMLM